MLTLWGLGNNLLKYDLNLNKTLLSIDLGPELPLHGHTFTEQQTILDSNCRTLGSSCTCSHSLDQSVCDVAPSGLTRPDDLHNLKRYALSYMMQLEFNVCADKHDQMYFIIKCRKMFTVTEHQVREHWPISDIHNVNWQSHIAYMYNNSLRLELGTFSWIALSSLQN